MVHLWRRLCWASAADPQFQQVSSTTTTVGTHMQRQVSATYLQAEGGHKNHGQQRNALDDSHRDYHHVKFGNQACSDLKTL